MKLILFAQLVLLAGQAPPPDLDGLLTAHDAAFEQRHHADRLALAGRLLDQAAAIDPGDCQLLWRQARAAAWLAEGEHEERRRLALAERARKLGTASLMKCPELAEGHYYAAIGVGLYAGGVGAMKALLEGLEKQFRQKLEAAQRKDEGIAHGNLHAAWARFYLSLPWPKHDAKKAEAHAARALALNPANLRARLALADLRAMQGRSAESRRLLEEILDAPEGRYNLPEELRVKHLARLRLTKGER